MTNKLAILLAVLVIPSVAADTFNEDFEEYRIAGINPELDPDQDWYRFSRTGDIGNVSADQGILNGDQSFLLHGGQGVTPKLGKAKFALVQPGQAESTTFWIRSDTQVNTTTGLQAFVALESQAPARRIVEFYVLCTDADFPLGCALNVRHELINTVGEELVPASMNQSTFKIHMEFDWRAGTYTLFVDDVNDGVFEFLAFPENLGALEIGKVRTDYTAKLYFDNWTVDGTPAIGEDAVLGDVGQGIKDFVDDAGFRGPTSKFVMGIAIAGILIAAVATLTRTLAGQSLASPVMAMFIIAVILWMTLLELWPVWIDLVLIILASTIASGLVRSVIIGAKDSNSSTMVILSAFSYLIAASSLLALGGFHADAIETPNAAPDEDGAANQNIVAQVAECAFGFITLKLACSKETETKTFKVISDVLNWGRAAVNFLFQLLTFSLPIPALFNTLIVVPPAVTIFVEAIRIIRG